MLWYGGGQDSTAILFKAVYDDAFKRQFIDGELIVVCSDTGNEFPETYTYIHEVVEPFCKQHDIHFAHLTSDKGFHPKTWHSLQAQFERSNGIMSVAFPKTCTDNLKVKPCYNYLEYFLKKRYGFDSTKPKSAYYQYFEKFGKLKVLIGFGADETERTGVNQQVKKDYSPVFVKKCIEKIYPLVRIGYNRFDCQDTIKRYGHIVPIPSNCMMCPFASEQEIVYLYKAEPNAYAQWVTYESAKIAKDTLRGKVKNFGVKGSLTLTQYTEKALLKYGHLSIEELYNHRFTHGHCVKSKY